MTLLRIYGFKTVYTLAGGANVVANCANPQQNRGIILDSATASRGSNLRLRWEYAPGSGLFVVYTDDYDTESRAASTALRNRAFVVKVNRLFRP